MDDIAKKALLQMLLQSPIGEELEKALGILEKVQQNMISLADKRGEEPLTRLKCGTILVLALFEKIVRGVNPKEFTKEDWAEVARAVSEYAVCASDQQYSVFVFSLYEDYIRQAASNLESKVSEKTVAAIRAQADELQKLAEQLVAGEISEVSYIEQSLWVSLEAIIKMLASLVGVVGGEEAEQLSVAVSSFAFEYGRYLLYRKEQQFLTECLASQAELDAELQERYEAYITELKENEQEFLLLIDHAFDADIRERLMSSARLAEASGVDEAEILHTMQDVDDFFMG